MDSNILISKYLRLSAHHIIQFMVGAVFVSEGIQKLVLPERGSIRFEKLGFYFSDILGPFTGTTELVFGLLVVWGYKVKFSLIPLFIIIFVAIYTTKIVPFSEKGLWETLHNSRNDFCILCGLCYLMAVNIKNNIEDK